MPRSRREHPELLRGEGKTDESSFGGRVTHSQRFSWGKVPINGLEGFWSDAKGKLLKHHGVSPQKLPLYLYEMQFRYNHRHEDLFQRFLDALIKPVPDV